MSQGISAEEVFCEGCQELGSQVAEGARNGVAPADVVFTGIPDHNIGQHDGLPDHAALAQATAEYAPVAELWYRGGNPNHPSAAAEAAYEAWDAKWGDRFHAVCHGVFAGPALLN